MTMNKTMILNEGFSKDYIFKKFAVIKMQYIMGWP